MKVQNNKAALTGTIVSDFEYSHEMYGEKFYTVFVESERTSGNKDVLKVMVSDRLMNVKESHVGQRVLIHGEFRSNRNDKGLLIFLFTQDIQILDEMQSGLDDNSIEIRGIIVKKPFHRVTPKGRDICDTVIAVHRGYNRSDYLPCIIWGRNSRFATTLEVGTEVIVSGRMQSREYVKHISDIETETRVAYEVSIAKIDVVEREGK